MSGPRYLIKLSLFVKSGGSENWDTLGSTREFVLFGGDGLSSLSGDVIALADRFLAAGLPGPLFFGDDILMGSNTGGCGESVGSTLTDLDLGVLPVFLVGVPAGGVLGVLMGLEHRELFFELKPFLLKSTFVRRLTPPEGVVNEEPLSSVFDDDVDDSVVRELSDERRFSEISI